MEDTELYSGNKSHCFLAFELKAAALELKGLILTWCWHLMQR